jgi:heparanase
VNSLFYLNSCISSFGCVSLTGSFTYFPLPHPPFHVISVIGPDTHSSAEYEASGQKWLETFSEASFDGSTSSAVDVVTFHMYSMGSGPKLNPNQLNASFLNSTALNKSGKGAKTVVQIVESSRLPTTPVWAGETASANNGGQSGVTDSWIDGFWYLDELGSHARQNVQVNCRQTLESFSGYPLLEKYQPLPDYWVALLFKRIMGSTVLNVTGVESSSGSGNSNVRVYAHCGVKSGIAIAWLNIGQNVEVLNFENIDVSGGLIWLLQPGKQMIGTSNPLQSQETKLNGNVLEVNIKSGALKLPNLDGIKINTDESIKAPGASYGFLHFPNADSTGCVKKK